MATWHYLPSFKKAWQVSNIKYFKVLPSYDNLESQTWNYLPISYQADLHLSIAKIYPSNAKKIK